MENLLGFIAYLQDKRSYLLVLILVLLGVTYVVHITKRQTNKITKEVGDLKQVVEKKLVKKDATRKAAEEENLLSFTLPAILLFFGLFSILLVATVLGTYFYYFDWPIPLDHDKWGTFGDFVGGSLNAILGLFGFMALLLTIVLQSQELALSRHELRVSANALLEQSKTVKLQQFEGTFFKLLELHTNILNSLSINLADGTVYKGSECLLFCLESFITNYSRYYDDEKVDKDSIFMDFLDFIRVNYGLTLTHYFAHLHNLLDFLDKDKTHVFVDDFGKEDKNAKQFYMKVLRSLLTKGETGLLFYAGISNSFDNCGIFRNREVIEKYALLMNVPDMGWVKREHCTYYDDSAFVED